MKSYLVTIALLVCSVAVAASLFHRKVPKVNKDVIVLNSTNSVLLNMPIVEETVRDAQMKLMELDDDSETPIYLVLNSPGGSIDSGMHLVETIKGMRRPVDSISIFSASMSLIISQYTRNRYVISSATLMAHRATLGGIEGQIPGSFFSRANNVMSQVTLLEEQIANRIGSTLDQYRVSVADELWLTGPDAVSTKFADKMITVRCDSSLTGYGPAQHFKVFIFEVTARFHRCPLIMVPAEVDSKDNDKYSDVVNAMFNDRAMFVRKYIGTGEFYKFIR